MTPTELVLLLTTLGQTLRWWIERRDARSELSSAKQKADSAVETMKEALEKKNEELGEMTEDRDYWRSTAMTFIARGMEVDR